VRELFNAFIETDAGKEVVNDEFADRLKKSNVVIGSLNQLQKFARERWQADYPRDWRKPTPPGARFGREKMNEWWGRYLEWSETGQ
jgi:protein tyrosine phosphatase